MPEVTFEMSPRGVTVRSTRNLDDGKIFYRVTEAALPTLRVVPNPRVAQFARVESIGWVLPIDDTSFRIYVAGRVEAARRHRPDALEVQRQVLVGHDRGGASALPRRLRGADRPGPDHAAFGGASRRRATAAS